MKRTLRALLEGVSSVISALRSKDEEQIVEMRRHTAYAAGKRTFLSHGRRLENPFPDGTFRQKAWFLGYDEAAREEMAIW